MTNFLKIPNTIAIAFLLLLVSGVYLWPMWTGFNKTVIQIPQYYRNLATWLTKHDDPKNRIVMTPLVGQGSAQQWDGTIYGGIDASSLLLNKPAVSYLLDIPYSIDFTMALRREMGVANIAPALSLLDARYLVARNDFLNEGIHQENYFVQSFHQPLTDNASEICNGAQNAKTDTAVTITCTLTDAEKTLQNIQYIAFTLQASHAAQLSVAVSDTKGQTKSWNNGFDKQFVLADNKPHTVFINLSSEEQPTVKIQFPTITQIQITANPLQPGSAMQPVILQKAVAIPFQAQSIHEYTSAYTDGKLHVYSPISFHPAPSFGLLQQVRFIPTVTSMFADVAEHRSYPEHNGYIVLDQNIHRVISGFTDRSQNHQKKTEEISPTRYLIQMDDSSSAYLLLSQTFSSQWKVIPNVSQKDMQNTLGNDIRLLSRPTVSESEHVVANGYANLWKIHNAHSYGVVFLPELYADIGYQITFGVIAVCVLILLYAFAKKRFVKHRKSA